MQRWAALGLILLGLTVLARAEDAAEVPDNDTSPYHQALLNYKSGHYDQARTAIDAAEKANPKDPATEILKARILIETHDFTGAKTALESLNGNSGLNPELENARDMAFGDMCLRKRSYDEASKFYEALLSRKPGDPDLILKIVYTRVGASDLVAAGQYASLLKPMDPKNPYDTHASYYFARAAVAQATGKAQEASEDIENARTIYGNTVVEHYLKTYLQVTSSLEKGPNSDLTPAPLVKTPAAK
jgi:tetratricopeptide (TPR) repeat protein